VTSLLGSAARAAAIATVAAVLASQVPHGTTLQAALLQLGAGGAVFVAVISVGVFTIGDQPVRDALRRLLHRIVPFASAARPR